MVHDGHCWSSCLRDHYLTTDSLNDKWLFVKWGIIYGCGAIITPTPTELNIK